MWEVCSSFLRLPFTTFPAPRRGLTALAYYAPSGSSLLRQAYLRRTKASIVICAGIALTIYEMGLFVVGIGLGLTRWDRVFSFLITAGYSFGVMVLLYPLINKIGLIGGTTWKE